MSDVKELDQTTEPLSVAVEDIEEKLNKFRKDQAIDNVKTETRDEKLLDGIKSTKRTILGVGVGGLAALAAAGGIPAGLYIKGICENFETVSKQLQELQKQMEDVKSKKTDLNSLKPTVEKMAWDVMQSDGAALVFEHMATSIPTIATKQDLEDMASSLSYQMNKQHSDNKEQLTKIKEDVDSLKQSDESQDQSIEQLITRADSHTFEIAQIKEAKDVNEERLISIETEIFNLGRELADLQNKFVAGQVDVNNNKHLLTELSKRMTMLKIELNNHANNLVRNLLEEYKKDTFEPKLQTILSKFDSSIQRMKDESLISWHDRRNKMRSDFRSMLADSLKKKTDEVLDTIRQEISAEGTLRQKSIDALSQRVDTLQAKVNSVEFLVKGLDEFKNKVLKLENDHKALKERVDSLEPNITQLTKESQRIDGEMTKLSQSFTAWMNNFDNIYKKQEADLQWLLTFVPHWTEIINLWDGIKQGKVAFKTTQESIVKIHKTLKGDDIVYKIQA